MADTLQAVQWTLAQSCALRTDGAVSDPRAALACTSRAQIYADALMRSTHGRGIHGDVCITSYTLVDSPKSQNITDALRYPSSGFIVSREFANVGGVDELAALCRACPANATPDRLAGCAGFLCQDPESTATQEQLDRIIGSGCRSVPEDGTLVVQLLATFSTITTGLGTASADS